MSTARSICFVLALAASRECAADPPDEEDDMVKQLNEQLAKLEEAHDGKIVDVDTAKANDRSSRAQKNQAADPPDEEEDTVNQLNEQLAKLEEAYDGKIVDVDTAEANWAQLQKELAEMKKGQREAVAKAMTGTGKAAKLVIEMWKTCSNAKCNAGQVAASLLSAIGELAPVFEAVLPSIAPFCPVIGVIGSIISVLSSSNSPVYPKPLTSADVQGAAERALQKFQHDDILDDWTALSNFFRSKADEYSALSDAIRSLNLSAQDTNDYIQINFMQAKWASDKTNFEAYVTQLEKDYLRFAGDGATSYRVQNIAELKPFQSNCSSSICRTGGIDTYRCTTSGYDNGRCVKDAVKNDCWDPLLKTKDNWASVLQMMNSYQVLVSQMTLWQLQIFSIVSQARGIRDSSGKVAYPAYADPGNLLWSVARQMRDPVRRQKMLEALTTTIFSTCGYRGWPLTQGCTDSNNCGYHYAYTDCTDPSSDATVQVVDRFYWSDFTTDCQRIYDANNGPHGFAAGGLYAMFSYPIRKCRRCPWYRVIEQHPCGEIRGYPSCLGLDDYHLIATPEYCVTNNACRDLFVNSSHWNL